MDVMRPEATQKFVRLVARLFTYARHGICLLSLYVQAVNVVFVFFQFLLGWKGWLIWTIKAFEISSKSFGVYGGWAVVLVEPVGPVDVDAI